MSGPRGRRRRPSLSTPEASDDSGVEVVFRSDGTATVRLGGTLRDGACPRRELTGALRVLVDEAAAPLRVRIVEVDGSRYEDVLRPRRRGAVDASGEATRREGDGGESDGHPVGHGTATVVVRAVKTGGSDGRLLEFHGAGFVPGEEVAVAVVVRQGSAGADGVARALVEEGEAPRGAGDVLLFGYVSGTVVTGSGLS